MTDLNSGSYFHQLGTDTSGSASYANVLEHITAQGGTIGVHTYSSSDGDLILYANSFTGDGTAQSVGIDTSGSPGTGTIVESPAHSSQFHNFTM
jgi:hypothetical protein